MDNAAADYLALVTDCRIAKAAYAMGPVDTRGERIHNNRVPHRRR